jgi:hypothetical protein
MKKYETLFYKISARIARKKCLVFLREDFADLGGYDQVGHILRSLVRAGKIIKIGYGLYAKAKKSSITGEVIPAAPLPILPKAAWNVWALKLCLLTWKETTVQAKQPRFQQGV